MQLKTQLHLSPLFPSRGREQAWAFASGWLRLAEAEEAVLEQGPAPPGRLGVRDSRWSRVAGSPVGSGGPYVFRANVSENTAPQRCHYLCGGMTREPNTFLSSLPWPLTTHHLQRQRRSQIPSSHPARGVRGHGSCCEMGHRY